MSSVAVAVESVSWFGFSLIVCYVLGRAVRRRNGLP